MESLNLKNFIPAFLKAKKSFKNTGLDGLNKHQNYKYALLKNIYAAVEEALHANGIVITHHSKPLLFGDKWKECIITQLIHEKSCEYIEDVRWIESEKPGNQGKGAANTYIKKQAVLGLCGIAPEEDDDCLSEEKYIEKKQRKLSYDNLAKLQEMIKSCSNSKEIYNNILKFNKISALSDIKEDQYENICSYINKNKSD